MRGLDPTGGRGRLVVRAGLWLAAAGVGLGLDWGLGVAARPAAAQGYLAAITGEQPGDPVEAAADRVRYWDVGAERWLILDGHAAVQRLADDGIRAERVVVRDVPDATIGPQGRRLEVYAEGKARPIARSGKAFDSYRMILRSPRAVELKPYEPSGLVPLKSAPAAEAALLRRAFPQTFSPAPRRDPRAAAAGRGATGPGAVVQRAAPPPTAPGGLRPEDLPRPGVPVGPRTPSTTRPRPRGPLDEDTLVNPTPPLAAPRPLAPPRPLAATDPATQGAPPVVAADPGPSAPATQEKPAAIVETPAPAPLPTADPGGASAVAEVPTASTTAPAGPPPVAELPTPPATAVAETPAATANEDKPTAPPPVKAPAARAEGIEPPKVAANTKAEEPVSPPAEGPMPRARIEGTAPTAAALPAPAPLPTADEDVAATATADEGPITSVTLGAPVEAPGAAPTATEARSKGSNDPALGRAQFPTVEPPAGAGAMEDGDRTAQRGQPGAPAVGDGDEPLPRIEPLNPDDGLPPAVEPLAPELDAPDDQPFQVPVLPGSQRVVDIYRGGPNTTIQRLERKASGEVVYVITGGVNIVSNDNVAPSLDPEDIEKREKRREQRRKRGEDEEDTGTGRVDITADNVVIWTRDPRGAPGPAGGLEGGQTLTQPTSAPLEIYMEGNVILRQDQKQLQGVSDTRTFRAPRAYYDLPAKRFYALDAELEQFVPGLIAPFKTKAPEILQYTPMTRDARGRVVPGLSQIRVEQPVSSGSRFPIPGYTFASRSMDLTQVPSKNREPVLAADGQMRPPLTTQIDARSNVFYIGSVPYFYWPRLVADADDPTPPFRDITYLYGNYFGNQVLTDWDGFKLFRIKKPTNGRFQADAWNVDIDYLSLRGPALGSAFAYTGSNPFGLFPNNGYGRYFGYNESWGIIDHGVDVLGTGPAVVTNGPLYAGKAGYQRSLVPPFQNFRGKLTARHWQSLLGPDPEADEDLRFQLELGDVSDRHFLEEYFKRLFDMGMDQETLFYGVYQKRDHSVTLQTEANLNNWYTETQWLPKISDYLLGRNLLGNLLTYSENSGVDYASTHTAVEVNNPNIFAFIPYDPVSNTSGTLNTGRVWTTHEVQMPLNLEYIRVTPYAQGQFVGWNNQLGDTPVARLWGAAGAKANVMLWRAFPTVENELLNVHGLNHKVNFDVDARFAYSNVNLNRIGIQDDLDDNTYEFVRRYFALTNYAGGLLPLQYDPRFLTLRRAIDPIVGTTDVQAAIDTVQLGIHQRLQTQRGAVGRRRIIDWMVLDLTTTYFPNAARDNFSTPFGQSMYNYEWYIGDRTSILSYGWFEFFNIQGQSLISQGNPTHTNDPFAFEVITTGISMSRPPRANLFVGYSIVNTGPIHTSALNLSYSYQLSPKWYSTFGTSYDFGNAVWLGSTISITRIGADFLTSLGVVADPQRNNYTFGIQITPRLSPSLRFGSVTGAGQFDSRYAATQ